MLGRAKVARKRNRNKEQEAQNQKRWRATNPENAMILDARRRAKVRAIKRDATLDELRSIVRGLEVRLGC
jgi:hypothetical protein